MDIENVNPSNEELNIQRYLVVKTEDGIKLCNGKHDKNAPCEWEYFVPKEPSP